MLIPAVIPFKPRNPKTRLSCILDQAERENFAEMMLADVIGAAEGAGCIPLILSTEAYKFSDYQVLVNTAGLNEALNDLLSKTPGPVLILMADLPLATGDAVKRMVTESAGMSIVPGRGGGTNAIFLSSGESYRVDYYGASFLKHMRIAEERGLLCEVIDSFRLHTDVDEKEDLVELLIHGRGKSRACLEELGFRLLIEKGRVGIVREEKA